MRAVVLALGAAVLVSGASSASADCDDPFRTPAEVIELHLRMGSTTWNALVLDEPQGAGCEAQYPYLDDAFRIHPQTVPFDTPLDDSCSPIGDRTRCQPDIAQRYLEIACQLTNGTLDEDRLVAVLDALDALVRPIVADEVDPVWAPHDRKSQPRGLAARMAARRARPRRARA